MTDKITLGQLGSLQNEPTAIELINNNSNLIQAGFDNTLSRDGTIPNSMAANLDMNSNQIINLPVPATLQSPVRLGDVLPGSVTITVPPVGTSGATVPLLNANNTFSGNNTHSGTENFTSTFEISGTAETFPASGLIVGTTDTQTITNKTLTAPKISTISNTGTLTLPTSTDTLVGRTTTDTLTNKTLTTPTLTSPAFAGTATGTLASSGIISTTNFLNTGGFQRIATTQTYTNNTPTATGISYNVVAGSTYIFEGYLFYSNGSAEGSLNQLGGTCTVSSLIVDHFTPNFTASANTTTGATFAGRVTALNTSFGSSAYTGDWSLCFRGIVTVSGTGTLTLLAAQNTTSATATSLLAGSYMKLYLVT